MHQIYISTGFMFVVVLFILGIVGMTLLYRYYRSQQKMQEMVRSGYAYPEGAIHEFPQKTQEYQTGFDQRPYSQPSSLRSGYVPPSSPSHTTVVQGGGNDMLTGVLVGSMISHDHGSPRHDTYSSSSDTGYSRSSSDSSSGSSFSSDSSFSFGD